MKTNSTLLLSPPERQRLCSDCIWASFLGRFSAPSGPGWRSAQSTADSELQTQFSVMSLQSKVTSGRVMGRSPEFSIRSCWISISLFSRVSIITWFSLKTLTARRKTKTTPTISTRNTRWWCWRCWSRFSVGSFSSKTTRSRFGLDGTGSDSR